MMFIIRSSGAPPGTDSVAIKAARKTPAIVPNGAGKTDYFCVAETGVVPVLREQGWEVVDLRDGWYADDAGGGIGIFGHGKYWEVRDTPLTVKEAVGPAGEAAQSQAASGDLVNVRGAIFGV